MHKCQSCGKEITEDLVSTCSYYQGRCPHQPSAINVSLYQARFYNLLQSIKGLFKLNKDKHNG